MDEARRRHDLATRLRPPPYEARRRQWLELDVSGLRRASDRGIIKHTDPVARFREPVRGTEATEPHRLQTRRGRYHVGHPRAPASPEPDLDAPDTLSVSTGSGQTAGGGRQ